MIHRKFIFLRNAQHVMEKGRDHVLIVMDRVE